MKNRRKIYYRKHEGNIVVEGKIKNKTTYLFSLPKDPEKLLLFLGMNLGVTKYTEDDENKSSFFTREKYEKIVNKLLQLDKQELKVVK